MWLVGFIMGIVLSVLVGCYGIDYEYINNDERNAHAMAHCNKYGDQLIKWKFNRNLSKNNDKFTIECTSIILTVHENQLQLKK